MKPKTPAPNPKNKKATTKNTKKKDDKNEEVEEIKDQFNNITELKVKLGNDLINDCFIYEQYAFCSCQDNNLYFVDLEEKKTLNMKEVKW